VTGIGWNAAGHALVALAARTGFGIQTWLIATADRFAHGEPVPGNSAPIGATITSVMEFNTGHLLPQGFVALAHGHDA
jgi:hypothetical protein